MKKFVSTVMGVAVGAFSLADSGATPVMFSIDLRGGAVPAPPTSFISYVVRPEDSNGDGWFETVLRINVGDPALSNPYRFADFQVVYGGQPIGLTVNIGDSSTNNGGSGDGATQTNDAEMQIGALLSNPPEFPTLRAFGRDLTPGNDPTLAVVPGLATSGGRVSLTVGNNFLSWGNDHGIAGSVTSPYLYALAGQPDFEGPVNYDIYAAFNRVVAGNYRIGAGVGEVDVCLRTASDRPCFAASVPEPQTLALVLFALGLTAVVRRKAS